VKWLGTGKTSSKDLALLIHAVKESAAAHGRDSPGLMGRVQKILRSESNYARALMTFCKKELGITQLPLHPAPYAVSS
jgi:hypothetical protein